MYVKSLTLTVDRTNVIYLYKILDEIELFAIGNYENGRG